VTVAGVKDWADAIFCTPSIAYACHAAYAERVIHEGKEWCCIVEVCVRPGSFSTHHSTVLKYVPLEAEPADPEMRVLTEPTAGVSETTSASEDAEVLRVKECTGTVVVLGIAFVSMSFVEGTSMDYHQLQELLQSK
jgi:hypothetical protein